MLRRWRFVLCGLLAGGLLGFGVGCQQASAENQRMMERMRAADPNSTICGLSMFAEVAVGLVWAVPSGLIGAALGFVSNRLLSGGRENGDRAERRDRDGPPRDVA